MLVSIPYNEIWVMPSPNVVQLAEHNAIFFSNRNDNRFDKITYDPRGKIAKKQKELNLDKTNSSGEKLAAVFKKNLNNFEIIQDALLTRIPQ